MSKADETTTAAGRADQAPGPETIRTVSYFSESLSGAVQGALCTLDLLKAQMLREAEGMDEGGTVANWAAVIGLVTAGLEEPHEDLEKTLHAYRSQAEVVA